MNDETSLLGGYWSVVQRSLPKVLFISFMVAIVVWLVASRVGPTYQVHFSYLVSLSEREDVADFRFDGYYALSATALFAETLARWAASPEIIVKAFEEAAIALPSDNPSDLVRMVEAVKTAPQLVGITIRSDDKEVAQKLAQGLAKIMEQNVDRYHDEGIPALRFNIVATEPWTGVKRVSVPIIVIATFVFVFFLSVNVVILRESLRN